MLIALQKAECLISELRNIISQNYCGSEQLLAELSNVLSKEGNDNLMRIIRELVNL